MIRTLFFIPLAAFSTMLGAIVVILIGLFESPSKWSYKLVLRPWGRALMFAAGSGPKLIGTERLEADRPYIIVCNHQSSMDVPALFGFLPMRVTMVAKEELFKIPIFAQGMRAFGILPIDRGNKIKAFQTISYAQQFIETHKISVLFFPEGTRGNGNELQRFKKGAFVMALNTRVDILPVVIKGTAPIIPKGKVWVRPNDVTITILPPVAVAGYDMKTKEKLIETVYQNMAAEYYDTENISG